MPHYTTYGGSYLSALPVDELTSKFDALNETNNFRPSKGESISVVHPDFRSSRTIDPEDGVNRANPTPHPGSHSDAVRADDIAWGNQGPVIYKALNETTNFRPTQSECISVVHPDFHTGLINPDSMRPVDFGSFEPRKSNSLEAIDLDFNDVLIGTFEDRHIGDYDANDTVLSMRQNLGTNSAPDGLTYITETLEPLAGMDGFAGSLNSVPGDSDTAGPLCKTYLEPQLGWSELCDVGLS